MGRKHLDQVRDEPLDRANVTEPDRQGGDDRAMVAAGEFVHFQIGYADSVVDKHMVDRDRRDRSPSSGPGAAKPRPVASPAWSSVALTSPPLRGDPAAVPSGETVSSAISGPLAGR